MKSDDNNIFNSSANDEFEVIVYHSSCATIVKNSIFGKYMCRLFMICYGNKNWIYIACKYKKRLVRRLKTFSANKIVVVSK